MTTPRSTQALLGLAANLLPGAALDIASHGATVAQSLGCGYLHDLLPACEAARAAGVDPVSHADHLPPGPYRAIFLDGRELDPALEAEWVAQAAHHLAPDGQLYTTARRAVVAQWFHELAEAGAALIARRPMDHSLPGSAAFTYPVELGEHSLTVQSAAGVFSPRSLDPGTRAMLAVIQAAPGQRFLDLGCGAGVVSMVASQVWGCQVTATDVSARALAVARANLPGVEVLASDGFGALRGRTFDIIASNPPYHTDFAVARGFVEGAHRHLVAGGWLYLVVKRADWYVQKVRAVFGGCRVEERDGYAIIAAEKRAERPARAGRAPEPATTKKHAKRMARSKWR